MSSRTVARQCTLCEAHCGILVTTEDDQVTQVVGDPSDVMSAGYICPKATAMGDLHHDPERLRQPVKKVGDGWEEISWDEAFSLVGSNLRRIRKDHGRNAVGMYFGNPSAHSPSVLYAEILRRVLRTQNIYSASSVDQFPQYLANQAMFGDHIVLPVVDIDRTDHLLVIGANPVVSNGSISTMPNAKQRLKDVKARGGRVVIVDPRRTESAKFADEHIAVRPGGDPYLLLGMLNVVFADGATVASHLEGKLAGWDELAELAAEWTPERCAPLAGVDADTITAAAREFAAADRAAAYARIGVCHHTTGSLTHWLTNALNAVTGNLDRAGGQMFTTPPVDVQQLLGLIAGKSGRARFRSRVRGLPELGGELPVAGLADEILTPGDGQVRAMIVYAGNPCLSAPESGRMDEAFESLDFFVSIDLYVTETNRHADVILPPTSQLERSEFDVVFPYVSVRNNARFSRAVFPKPDGAKHDWEILLGIAGEIGDLPGMGLMRGPLRLAARGLDPQVVTAPLVAAGPQGVLRKGPRGLTLGKIKKAKGGVDLGPLESRLDAILRTADKKVHLAPDLLMEEARRLDNPTAAGLTSGPTEEFDLQLIGRRHLRTNNSWLHNIENMVKGRDRCTALMHPDDAHDRALDEGHRVEVTSPVGSIEVPLEISDEIRRGVVAIPHGWGHDVKGVGWSTAAAHGGANVNILTDSSLVDRLSGNGALNATWVRVERAEQVIEQTDESELEHV